MGQAKRRGTRDERIAQSIERQRIQDEQARARLNVEHQALLARHAEARRREPQVVMVVRPGDQIRPVRRIAHIGRGALIGIALASLIK